MSKKTSGEKSLSAKQKKELLDVLKSRFEKNRLRHNEIKWTQVLNRLERNTKALWSLSEMERTGGEPDVVDFEKRTKEFIFCDCSSESPAGRRSLCYDDKALHSRKEHKPGDSALGMANRMGIEILSEEMYRELQSFGIFDTKTSNWIKTPSDIRELGGAVFCDFRYGKVFTYHNGAGSYYAARGFRGFIRV